MAGHIEMSDGRSITIKVNGKIAEYLFDAEETETFDVTEAVEWVDEDNEIHIIQSDDKIEIKVWGVE